jgi:hypothetical protein
MTSAALLERYRGTEHEGPLLKLSMLSTPETENTDSILGTYSDLVRRLHIDDRYTYLQTKMESSRLSQEELEEYSQIISNR